MTTAVEEAALSNEEILRYSRHLIIPEVGMEGQQKLKAAKVLLIGAGGLGAPLSLYLTAAGVGRIGIVDFDVVDSTNLQRQVIHSTADVGRKKIDSAAEKMRAINPNVNVVKHETALTSENALEILKDYDLVVDGTDNFPTRYLVNDACVLLGKPNVYGSIFRFEGQATETVKLILGIGEPLVGRLLLYDALGMRFREMKLRKNPECPVCGEHPTITRLIDYHQFCGVPQASAAPAVQETKVNQGEIDVVELKQKMDRGDDFVLIDVREPHEYRICSIPGAKLIPLGEFPKHVGEFDANADIVIHCRSGMRSAKACAVLRQNGFQHVRNVVGGILAWSDKVDPSVPKY